MSGQDLDLVLPALIDTPIHGTCQDHLGILGMSERGGGGGCCISFCFNSLCLVNQA